MKLNSSSIEFVAADVSPLHLQSDEVRANSGRLLQFGVLTRETIRDLLYMNLPGVAQVGNLLYRRLVVGWTQKSRTAADCQSATLIASLRYGSRAQGAVKVRGGFSWKRFALSLCLLLGLVGSVFSALDVVPSLLSLAGVKIPANTFDGENVADTLVGKSTVSRQSPLFWRRPPDRPSEAGNNLPDLAVREGQWKLLCEYDGSLPQLYDLSQDRAETRNLAADHPELERRLTAAVREWYQSAPQPN